MSAEAPWLDAPVVDDPEPWKQAPIVEDAEQPWLSAPIVGETETIPAGHPDRADELTATAADDRMREINKRYFEQGPQSLNTEETELRNKWRVEAGSEVLAGTILDPKNALIQDPVLGARVGADALAASGIAPGKLDLKTLDETLKHFNPFLKMDEALEPGSTPELVPLEELRHSPIIQAPTLAEPTVAGGVANAVLNTVSGLTTPENLTLMTGMGAAPKLLQQAASLGFSGVMIKDAVDRLSEGPEDETPGQKTQRITEGVLSLIMGAAAGKHGVDGRAPIAAQERSSSMRQAASKVEDAALEPGTRIDTGWGLYEKRPGGEWREVDENGMILSDTRIIGVPKGEIVTKAEPAKPTSEPSTARTPPQTPPELLPSQEASALAKNGKPLAETQTPSAQAAGQTKPIAEGLRAEDPNATGQARPAAQSWRQQALPEELRTTPELEEALTPTKVQSERAPMVEKSFATGGELGGGGGGKTVVKPVGTTPKGDTAFIRVESALKRVGRGLFTEGVGDVLAKSKNKIGQLLSKQVRKHVDLEQEITGQLTAELDRATKGMSKGDVKKAIDELEPYIAAKENGRPLPPISKNAQSVLTAWENIAERTGLMSEAHDVQVFDPTTGGYRPMHRIGRAYVPRMFKPEVQKVLQDPRTNPTLFNDLAKALAAHRGVTMEAAAAELRGVAGRFQASDFMGNMEMARTGQLPEVFYDYNLGNMAARYIPSFSERMSQIISYGQRLGPREAPVRENLWDVAMKEAEDSYTQQWLRSAEDQAVNLRAAGGFERVAQRAQTLASGLLLSSPTTSVLRNMLSGLASTTELMGVRRSLAQLKILKDATAKLDAREIGAVRENLGEFFHADKLENSKWDELVRGVVDPLFKYSGYNKGEGFVRTHAAATASQFAKDGVAAIAKKPSSMAAKEALGLFKRMGVDAEKIVAEGADWKTGAETRKFIRTVIRDSQGGYKFDQVPLWAGSAAGRLLYQFGRYGVQRSRNIWKNGILPLLGEEVQWHGKTMVRRDARPFIKMGISAVVLGEAYALLSQGFFGRDRKDASVQEISEAWDEDKKKAALLAAERMVNDIIMSGSLGIAGQPVDFAKSMKDKGRFRNPAEPPAAASTKAVVKLAQNAIDQEGRVTNKDLWEFFGGVAPGAKQLTDLGRNIFDEDLYEAENDVRTLRTAATRWAAANKLDVPKRSITDTRKSANSPEYEEIQAALMTGDADRARFLAAQFVDVEKTEEARKKARASVKNSVKQRQPFRVGPFTNGEYKGEFMTWAEKHLPKKDYEQAKRVQDRYEAAANAAGLW